MTNRIRPSTCVYSPDIFSPIVEVDQIVRPLATTALKHKILELGVPYVRLLDHIVDLNRDYEGRFFDASEGFLDHETGIFKEVFVDMEPLEEAPVEWWRDNFGPAVTARPIKRVRCEAQPRWQALGSVYFAWHPWERITWNLEAANDNHPPATA